MEGNQNNEISQNSVNSEELNSFGRYFDDVQTLLTSDGSHHCPPTQKCWQKNLKGKEIDLYSLTRSNLCTQEMKIMEES